MKKLQLVRAISPLPNRIREDIERLNALRNGIAHAFFPENLKKSKPAWKGKGIFTPMGIERYQQDIRVVVDYFLRGHPMPPPPNPITISRERVGFLARDPKHRTRGGIGGTGALKGVEIGISGRKSGPGKPFEVLLPGEVLSECSIPDLLE